MPDNKLYDLLGVSRSATDQEIKKVDQFVFVGKFIHLNVVVCLGVP